LIATRRVRRIERGDRTRGGDGVSDSDGSSPKIKVVDRRWFTEDGDPRSDRPRSAEPAPELASVASAESERRDQPPVTSREFIELVAMLAHQAELMVVGAEGLEPHPDEARRLIDALAVLETKTRGNLSREESTLLSDVLFQLRRLFVQGRR
jgi:hypothetical protein